MWLRSNPVLRLRPKKGGHSITLNVQSRWKWESVDTKHMGTPRSLWLVAKVRLSVDPEELYTRKPGIREVIHQWKNL